MYIICISVILVVILLCATILKIVQIKEESCGEFIDPISERIQYIEFCDVLSDEDKKELICFIVRNKN
jgi:hypothetical protein